MSLFQSLSGFVRVQLTSADLSGVLRRISGENITICDLATADELTASFTITRKSIKRLEQICTKSGDVLRIEYRMGLFWKLAALRKRPVLVTGLFLIALAAIFLPGRVLFIEVEGNHTIAQQQILEAAEECGIRFGASRREVRSEKVKNSLLGALPQLQWAGINTYGCRAVITVRERPTEEQEPEAGAVSSIVAALDGVVTDCTVTRGNGLCMPGQAVTKGQVLISGYTDCGITIQATRAEGEIMALTKHNLSVTTPSEWHVRREPGSQRVLFSLILGKKRINFYKGSGISGGSCVKMYSKYVLTLPGGFELPLTIVREVMIPVDTAPERIPGPEELLHNYAKQYLSGRMVAGQILQETVHFCEGEGIFRVDGVFFCQESIGMRREEKIGEHYGKTNGTDRERGSGG